MIGGSTDQRNPEMASTAVTRICLSRSFVRRVAPLPVATWRPAVATAPNMITVCGGTSNGEPLPSCQVYSRKTDKYAGLLETILTCIAPPPHDFYGIYKCYTLQGKRVSLGSFKAPVCEPEVNIYMQGRQIDQLTSHKYGIIGCSL